MGAEEIVKQDLEASKSEPMHISSGMDTKKEISANTKSIVTTEVTSTDIKTSKDSDEDKSAFDPASKNIKPDDEVSKAAVAPKEAPSSLETSSDQSPSQPATEKVEKIKKV